MVDGSGSALRRARSRVPTFETVARSRVAPRLLGIEPRRSPPPRSEDLDAELYQLAHSAGPLRRALARVAGRLVAVRGWERLGFARLADYAVERAGISPRELRDLARVDRAFESLPRLEQAFLAGEIGWTELRLLCRVAQPDDEREWLARASRLTASALAREVRQVDRRAREASAGIGAPEEDDERSVGVIVRCTPSVRARWWHARQVANRVAGHTLSAGAFLEAVTAEVISAVGFQGESSNDSKSAPPAMSHEDFELSRADAKRVPPQAPLQPGPPPPFITSLTHDIENADPFELDARLRRAVRRETRRLAHLAARLEQAVVLGLPRAMGFASLDIYAEERLGIAASRARALLRVSRAASECPPLRKAFATGRLSWVQAHALVPLLFETATRRYREAWVLHAERVSVRRLSDDIERALGTGVFEPPSLAPPPCPSDPVDLQIGAITHPPSDREHPVPQTERVRLFVAASLEVAHLFRAALAIVQRRLEHLRRRPASQSEALEAMLAHAVATWVAQDPHDHALRDHRVFERDGWRCTVPGCSSYRNLHGHHIVFRSQGGTNALSNLTTLCSWHHQRGVHGGVISCSGRAPHALHFALLLRPNHLPLLCYGPGEVRMG